MHRRDFLLALAGTLGAGPLLASAESVPRLLPVDSPYRPDHLANLQNPFFLEEQPGATLTTGWLDAWTTRPCPQAVAARSAADVAEALRFCRKHGLRPVIKATGHDYLGRSNGGPDCLLVWTHPMRRVEMVGETVRLEAGARWLEVYSVAQAAGRYAQGGGCTSVGAAGGFLQGSGFGSFSRRYGTGAAGALEFEVVTADGQVRLANEREHPDLYWALRGGGGGTFAVVTRVTLRTHPLPGSAGLVEGRLRARDFRRFLEAFARFYPALNNEHWGEQIAIGPDDRLELGLTYHDLSESQARAVWEPLLNEAEVESFTVRPLDPAHLWDYDWFARQRPDFVTRNPLNPAQYWWSSNQAEVSAFLHSYQSRWLPFELFSRPAALADLLYSASRHWRIHLHLNKALSGAHPEALERTRQTCLHPAAFEAAALAIVASQQPLAIPGLPGHEPDLAAAREAARRVRAAADLLRAATPNGGTYANEADYFEADWQRAFWGPHYERLLAIKRRYDPENLLRVHHGVGS